MKKLLYILIIVLFVSCVEDKKESKEVSEENVDTEVSRTKVETNKNSDYNLESGERVGKDPEEINNKLDGLDSKKVSGNSKSSGVTLNPDMFSDEQLKQMGVSREKFEEYLKSQQSGKSNQNKNTLSGLKSAFGGNKEDIKKLIEEEKRAIHNIRYALNTSEILYIEDHMRNKKAMSLERMNAYNKLKTAPNSEGKDILQGYLGVTDKEFELLKLLPRIQNILSESKAKEMVRYQVHDNITLHLKSEQASTKFEILIQGHTNLMEKYCTRFLKSAKLARSQFYRKNPG